jgi:hypothetical protein
MISGRIDNIINHIVLVLDASASMSHIAQELVDVADNQVKYLAMRSQELDQETRITVYIFNTTHSTQCLIYDKDVLRMPSIAGLYRASGATPLIDATLLALNDLALTPEKYGQHSFLIYVLTDGQENSSRAKPTQLSDKINGLPDNWTLAAFVPNQTSIFEAKKFGFPKENIAIWDTTSAGGLNEVGERIRQTTETFMQNRSKGIRGSRTLFTMDAPSIATVTTTLTPLHHGQFRTLDVTETSRIDQFVESELNRPYKLGEAYYQLTKTETIQPQKEIAILTKDGLYKGRGARDLLGLPDYNVKVKPDFIPDYIIFVQSTSVNRKLVAGTRLLILS